MPSFPSRRPGSALRIEQLEDRTVPSFSPFQLTGGESVAVGDVFPEVGPGVANEIVVGAGPGQQPYVRVYSLAGVLEAEFLAYEPTFLGGVNVAIGNTVIDATAVRNDYREIVTGPGYGGGPIVKVFNPNNRTAVKQILAFEPSFRGGVNVAAGDVNTASATDEIVVGAGYGGGPVVRVYNADGTPYSSFYAYESSFRNGVNVACADLIAPTAIGGGLPGAEIATGPGEGGAPLLKIFTGTGVQARAFYAFDQAKRNGLSLAVGQSETVLPGADIYAVEQFTPSDVTPVFRAFHESNPGQITAQFTPFPAGYSRYYNMAVGDVDPFNTNGNNNSADWVGVAGEGQIGQTPRIQYGLTTSAAGNNGP